MLQVGIFKLEYMVKVDGFKVLFDFIYKVGFKVMIMIFFCDQFLLKEIVLEYVDFFVSLKGFEILGVLGLIEVLIYIKNGCMNGLLKLFLILLILFQNQFLRI